MTTIDGSGEDHAAGLRWLLHGDVGFGDYDQDDVPLGVCAEIEGLFVDLPPRPSEVPRVRLVGCRAEPALLAAVGAIGESTNAGRRRRWVRAEVHMVAADGSVGQIIDAVVSGTVRAAEPSRIGAGLLEITIDCDRWEPLPAGVLEILDDWRAGRPAENNLWADYDRELRHQWSGVALGRLPGGPDRPAGTVYDLDGRFVTDVEGFYCAIGEAINGPGGYFGWNLDALRDCLHGGFGARAPFGLVWHDAVVAREHLVDGYDERRQGPAVSLRYLVDFLAAQRVEIDLR